MIDTPRKSHENYGEPDTTVKVLQVISRSSMPPSADSVLLNKVKEERKTSTLAYYTTGRNEFQDVSSLHNLLYKISIERTFETFLFVQKHAHMHTYAQTRIYMYM